jgi:hypothetical protein
LIPTFHHERLRYKQDVFFITILLLYILQVTNKVIAINAIVESTKQYTCQITKIVSVLLINTVQRKEESP